MASQRDIKLRAILDARKAVAEAQRLARGLDDVDKVAKKTDKGLGLVAKGALAMGAAFVGTRIVGFAKDSLNLAVAAEEAGNKFDAVFGPAAESLGTELDKLGDKAGIADFVLRNITATTGNVIQGLGGTREEARALVSELAPAAIDVASFNGSIGDAPEVLQAMTSALVGEREALKNLGIVIREADVQQQALMETGKASAKELTNLEKAQATLTLIMEGMGQAAGDLERNLDTAATAQAQLSAEWKEAQAALGEELLPVMSDLIPVMKDLIGLMGPLARGLGFVVDNIHSVATAFATDMDPGQVDEMKQAIELMGDAVEDGMDPTTALAAALATLAVNGSLTKDSFRELAKASGLTADEIDDAATAAHGAADEADLLADKSVTLAGAVKRAADQVRGVVDEEEFWARNMGGRVTPEVEELTDEVDTLNRSLVEQRTQLQRLADPYFNLAKAQDDVAAAQAHLTAVQEDGEATAEDLRAAQLRLILTNGALRVAQDGVTDGGEAARLQFINQGLAIGFTRAEMEAMSRSIDRYNLKKIDGKTFLFHIAGGGGTIKVTPGGNVALASGGIVKASAGGTAAVVGEGGDDEAVVPLNDQGIGFLAKALAAAGLGGGGVAGGGGGGTTVIPISIGGRVIEEIVIDANRRATRRGRSL